MCNSQASRQLSETLNDETQSNSGFFFPPPSFFIDRPGEWCKSIDMQMGVKGHLYINLWIMWGWK